MRRSIMLLATLAFAAGLAGSVNAAPALGADGKCRDAGKFVKADLCKKPLAAAPAGKCRDIKTKAFAKCSAAGTEPVPAKKP